MSNLSGKSLLYVDSLGQICSCCMYNTMIKFSKMLAPKARDIFTTTFSDCSPYGNGTLTWNIDRWSRKIRHECHLEMRSLND